MIAREGKVCLEMVDQVRKINKAKIHRYCGDGDNYDLPCIFLQVLYLFNEKIILAELAEMGVAKLSTKAGELLGNHEHNQFGR